jgi:hypothetical protein
MYRGSRLGASFLLVLTGSAVSALALLVLPGTAGASPLAIVAGILFAAGHWVALGGVIAGRDWGRNLAVFVAEIGGGLAILSVIALLVGAHPFGSSPAGPGLAAWTAFVYAVLGVAAGRVPVLSRLSELERARLVGPVFHGVTG